MANLSQFLSKAQGEWGKTIEKAKSSSFENPPDGSYIVQISAAELGESKAGKTQIKWSYTVLEGELAGQTNNEYMGLEGPLALDPLAWRFQALGIKLEDLDLRKLEEYLDDIISQNIVMKITLKTKPNSDFQNLRVQKILPNYQVEDEAYTTTTNDDLGEAEESSEAVEVEQVELAAGMKVSFSKDSKKMEGIVKEVREEGNECDIRVGVKTHTIPITDITGVVEESTDA